MTTKERIIEEALTLFAEKGYQGTSVKNIADAVGIKDSSLYKHYKSEQEIFDTIVQEMSLRMERISLDFGLPGEIRIWERPAHRMAVSRLRHCWHLAGASFCFI